ncbi:MAG: sulfatase-like hydrolase/transferase, partial [Pelagibacterales bacterium]|nr:sulfatase-like hydrolase/transferase [Pelagibacterales bacterium]
MRPIHLLIKAFYNKQAGRWESVIFGMIQAIDDQVGKILKFLEEKRLEENTIVIFMSDNGPA